MITLFFKQCQSLDEAKREYKRLALMHHPDRGGDTSTMQEINRQYQEIIRNPNINLSQEITEDLIRFAEIIEKIIRFDLTIEVCGNWIWLSGNTRNYKEDLKQIGFFYAPRKAMWYWRPEDYKSANTKPKDMDYIRAKYGSDIVAKQDKSLKDQEATR
jgi:hypothetical protein